MSRQIELARQAVQDLLSGAKSTAIFQRQVKVADHVYLQLITAAGVVSFRVSGVKEPDTRITTLTEPFTWDKLSKGRVILKNEDLAIEPSEKHLDVLVKISDTEATRIAAIMYSENSPIAPASAVTANTAAVLTQDNQTCLWLQDDTADAPVRSPKQAQWTRNAENISGVYGVLNPKIRQIRINQPNIDAVSVGSLNGPCVISFRDTEHHLLITTIVAVPTSFPLELIYVDRGKSHVVELKDDGTYKIKERQELSENDMKTKLTDPRTLLNPQPRAVEPATEPEKEDERKFDTAENVTISEAADGTIVTEEVAPAPEANIEPVAEPTTQETTPTELPEQSATEEAPKQEEAPEPSFEEQLDQLITFLTDMSQYCKGGIAGVKAMKKRYKEEAKQLRRSAKESEEFIAMKSKLDKALADKDKAVAQLNKVKNLLSLD